MSRHYVDTSALVKLIVEEPESDAVTALAARSVFTVSVVGVVELTRAVRRSGLAHCGPRLEALLRSIDRVALTAAVVDTARILDPPTVRSLDAIHVATALMLGRSITGVVTYDTRMAQAANGAGLRVLVPTLD